MELFRKISDNPSIVWINGEVVAERIDADYYHANHIQLNKSKIPMFKISTYCYLSKKRFNPNKYNKEYFKYIDISNVDNNTGVFEYQLVNINEAPSRARKKVSKNDIIISTVRPNRNAVAIVNIEDDELVASTGFAVIECKKNIDSYYLFAVLKTSNSIGQLVRKTSGGLYPAVSEQDVMEIEIPIPSPEIQKYIGDKVRKAEELREEAKRLKKEAEEILNAELKLSYFNERVKDAPKIYNWIYGESIEIRIDSQYYINETNFINNEMYKKGLKLKRISEIANVGKGFSYTSLDNKSIPYIRISDLDDLLINFDTAELVDEKTYSEKKSSQLEKYDLIFAITGATIGKVSLFYNSKYSKATLSSDTAFVRLKDKNDAAYVLLYLKSFIGQLGILKGVTGATNRHLSLEHIGDIFIPVIDNKLKQEINMRVIKAIDNVYLSKQLIKEAKQDVEDLIEGNFDMSKVKANS